MVEIEFSLDLSTVSPFKFITIGTSDMDEFWGAEDLIGLSLLSPGTSWGVDKPSSS